MQRGNELWVPAPRIPGRTSYDLPGGQQQAPPARSATVGIPEPWKCRALRKIAKGLRSCGTPVREARSLACGASHGCVESVGGVQVAVVAGRGCGLSRAGGAILE